MERLHRHGHGEPTLARARRADAERDGVGPDRVDVPLLAGGLRAHHAPPRALQDVVREDGARSLLGPHHDDAAVHDRLVETLPLLQQQHHLLEQAANLVRPRPGARDLVAPHDHGHIGECVLDAPEKLVALAEEFGHQMGAGGDDRNGGGGVSHRALRLPKGNPLTVFPPVVPSERMSTPVGPARPKVR